MVIQHQRRSSKSDEDDFTTFVPVANISEFKNEIKTLIQLYTPFVQGRQLEINILSHVDDIKVRRKRAESRNIGPEWSIVDEQLVDGDIRRRLRFKSCPGYIQSEVRMIRKNNTFPVVEDYRHIWEQEVSLVVDRRSLVDEFSPWMVGGLSLISKHLSKIKEPRVLCLGFGAGVVSEFLRVNLGFKIVGVEENADLIEIAMGWYDCSKSPNNVVIEGDATKIVKRFASGSLKDFKSIFFEALLRCYEASEIFQAIILDINSVDKKGPFGVISPPKNFFSEKFLKEMSSCMDDKGILVINVVSPSYVFYGQLVQAVKNCYSKVYRNNSDDHKTFVLYALKSADKLSDDSDFLTKLGKVIPDVFIKWIVEL